VHYNQKDKKLKFYVEITFTVRPILVEANYELPSIKWQNQQKSRYQCRTDWPQCL